MSLLALLREQRTAHRDRIKALEEAAREAQAVIASVLNDAGAGIGLLGGESLVGLTNLRARLDALLAPDEESKP